jgi:hypothetical protein
LSSFWRFSFARNLTLIENYAGKILGFVGAGFWKCVIDFLETLKSCIFFTIPQTFPNFPPLINSSKSQQTSEKTIILIDRFFNLFFPKISIWDFSVDFPKCKIN